MGTPHIDAKPGDFAKTVLMPGDPLRSKFIAEHFFENPVLVNNVRGVQGYTGTYKGKKVSVMASGMGMPSMGIYSQELFTEFGVENIIRIGTAGVVEPGLKIGDVVMGMGACTNSNFAKHIGLAGYYAPIASFELLEKAVAVSRSLGKEPIVGNIASSDNFYTEDKQLEKWQKMGVLAAEMEAAGLYTVAARYGKKALALVTISDNPFTGEESSAEEREKTFTQMMEIALEVAIQYED
ncbi:MAG: purine-nucleoside phosphorylase [Clostridia bacterium]|nr:purine-nucleoside phosphorylase [Clostridia bacterium]